MLYGLVHYPSITREDFFSFTGKYNPFVDLIAPEITFVFPTPSSIGRENLEAHVARVLSNWEPFEVHFQPLKKTFDHWLYLASTEGKEAMIRLHDDLYTGILHAYLRDDLPYDPHIGLGLFTLEPYDFLHPTASLTLDSSRFHRARKEFESLNFEYWGLVDRLFLVEIDQEFTRTRNLREFVMG